MNFAFVKLFSIIIFMDYVESTTDINCKQLQMVADRLTLAECRKLSETLHSDDYEIGHPTGEDEPQNLSCLQLLEHWNTHEGQKKTFHQLAQRLQQIGHTDVANKLSKTVYGEKILDVKESFLDDPFKDHIKNRLPIKYNSIMTSEGADIDVDNTKSGWSQMDIMYLLCFIIVGFVFILLGCWKCLGILFFNRMTDDYSGYLIGNSSLIRNRNVLL
ncbi:uncharacterized protein LOC143236424 [Tachypleus tridentatus]|uniref:uncharacterized protein LOC143236424 n=1 Tax=Tachypleus tridentatus TaxID=6853 RepID=UPI003FD02397